MRINKYELITEIAMLCDELEAHKRHAEDLQRDIEACPFCGDAPLLKHSACDSRYAYICHTCSSERLVQTKWLKTETEALEAWNRRAECLTER